MNPGALIRKYPHIIAIVGVLALVAAGAIGYGFREIGDAAKLQKNQSLTGTEELLGLLERHMVLPDGETPTIATVEDINPLKGQEFFTNAQNGDKVFIFLESKQAVLYRPSTDRIIRVAPVNATQTDATASAGTAPATTPSPIRFALYNGTSASGLTRSYEATLRELVNGVEITSRANAVGSYAQSLLVVLDEALAGQGDVLAKKLGMTLSALPDGETAPQATDILIILGADRVAGTPVPAASGE